MNPLAVGAAFNRQLRQDVRSSPGTSVEQNEFVTRLVGEGWSGVVWSDLADADVDEVIAGEVARFAGASWEWKHYSGDARPTCRSDCWAPASSPTRRSR